MADVRCPMCSAVNPEGRDTCKVCGARLTPVSSGIAAGNMESIHPGDEPVKKSTAELEHALPDWLQDLRKKPETGELLPARSAESPVIPPAGASETDEDFLSRLASESGQESAVSAQPESTDWLAGLSDAKGGDEAIPDWLLGVQKSVDEEATAAKLAAASQPSPDANVDWFQQLQEDQKAARGEDSSQWPGFYSEPAGFGKMGQDDTLISQPASDWYMPPGEEKAPEVADASRPTGVTDWLKKLKQDGTAAAPPASSTTDDTTSAPLPDWLAFTRAPTPETQASTPAAANEIPDWLSAAQAEQPPAVEIPPTASAPSGDMPDWLLAAQAEQPATPGVPTGEEPDWLSSFASDQIAAEPPAAQAPEKQGLPDWLAAAAAGGLAAGALTPKEEIPQDILGGFPAAVPLSAPQPLPQEVDSPADSFSLGEDMPDWLSELPGAPGPVAPDRKPTAPLPAVPAAPASAAGAQPPAEKGEPPAWLAGAAAAAAASKASSVFTDQPAAANDALSMEMPDWLSGITPVEPGPATASTQGGPAASSEALIPGELPAWVQAMRPVEAVIAETAGDVDDEQYVESQGPLAGFQNVLPFVPGLIAIRRPAVYSSKLQVNSGQQANAALLEGLLSSESDAAKVKNVSHLHYNKFLRWMIALLLIVLVAIPIVLGSTLTPVNKLPPEVPLYPRELKAAYDVIEALPSNPNVLVVFDYEPAFSGEMSTASAPVLDQLMAKGATIAAVSSLPTGSVQANLLMATLLKSYNYLEGNSYVNLGYIPGGAAGIYNFATNPSGTISVDAEGNQPWTTSGSFLADTRALSDFDSMVILVDSSETARVWIEQSRLPLEATPLLMVISAQSEPMILPYYDSKQVQGVVTGLYGGANYELITSKPGAGRLFWDAFAVAFFVAEIIVVVGGVWALIAAWQARLARKDEEA